MSAGPASYPPAAATTSSVASPSRNPAPRPHTVTSHWTRHRPGWCRWCTAYRRWQRCSPGTCSCNAWPTAATTPSRPSRTPLVLTGSPPSGPDRLPTVRPLDLEQDPAGTDPHGTVRALLQAETPESRVTGATVQQLTGLSRSRAYAVLRQLRHQTTSPNGHPPADLDGTS